MAWYELMVTPQKQRDYVAGGRILLVWDERPLGKITQMLKDNGSVTLARAAFSHDKTRVEHRGLIVMFDGHLISIEQRLDLDARHPKGPTERLPY